MEARLHVAAEAGAFIEAQDGFISPPGEQHNFVAIFIPCRIGSGIKNDPAIAASPIFGMGDDVLYFFLADLIVDPAFRGERLGERLMQAVTSHFAACAKPGASITLIPLKGRESFYERFGYVRCPDGPFGTGMHYASAPPPADVQ